MIDRELLWKAWPTGSLAIKGMSTVGGYDCIPGRDGELHWFPRSGIPHMPAGSWYDKEGTHPAIKHAIKQGDLLPNVDPADVASWGAIKTDLADALGDTMRPIGTDMQPIPNFSAELIWIRNNDAPGWIIECEPFSEVIVGCSFDFPDIKTEDPALALVFARIQAREETRR